MTTILCPISLQTVFDNGQPLVGAKVFIFEAGTTTPKPVYQESTGQVIHPHPVLTNGQGRIPPIYIGAGAYKIRLLKPSGDPIEEVDGLPGAADAESFGDVITRLIDTTSGSPVITFDSADDLLNLQVGMLVEAIGIPIGAVITAITNSAPTFSATLSQNATATDTAVSADFKLLSYPLADPTAVLRTGDIVWAFDTGPRQGFARLNGNTIGSAATNASEVAVGALTSDPQPLGSALALFRFLWDTNRLNAPLDEGAGKGPSADADWNSGRKIILPNIAGRTFVGVGAGPAEILKTLDTANASANLIAGSAAGLEGVAVGMAANGPGIPTGATVVSITNDPAGPAFRITLSLAATATATGVSVRFSPLTDARELGATGGAVSTTLSAAQMPKHGHNVAVPSSGQHEHSLGPSGVDVLSAAGGHNHSYTRTQITSEDKGPVEGGTGSVVVFDLAFNSGTVNTSSEPAHRHTFTNAARAQNSPLSAHSHAVTQEDRGGDEAHSNMQPSLTAMAYIKL